MAEQTIDRLSIEINAKANASVGGIDRLSQSIQRLKSAVGGGTDKLSGIAASIDKLKTALSGFKGTSGSVSSLAKSLERLQAIKLEGAGAKLSELSNAAKSLSAVGDSLQSIRDFGKGVTSMTKSFDKLEKMDIKSISARILELVAALKPLTNEMIRAGSGVSNFGDQMKSLAQALRSANSMKSQIAKQTQRSRSGTGGLNELFSIAKVGAVIYGLERVGRAIKGAIGNVNSYIEDMNLFAVSMGSAAREGEDLAQKMQDLLGVDAGQAMRNMGVFRQMTTSFGVAGEKATVLSKNLTQLGYDMASFYNINSDAAFEKLQAGISGETEPLRRLGIDISEARLQQELYNLGIKESVRNLSQADKAQLRYIAIMEQTKNAQADMARTIMSPANALRVLQAQLQITARNIGSIFIPALNAVLPYAIAVVKVIGELAARLAQLVGFKMPDFEIPETSLPDISGDLGDIGDEAEKAGKKMNQLISGFDELNILSKDTGIDKSEIGDILGNIELPEYDPFKGLETSNVDKIVDDINRALKNLKDTLMDLGLAEVLDNFKNFFKAIKDQIDHYDFATAIKDALLKGFELAMSLINAAQRIVFPIAIALDIPGIVYEAINTLTALFSMLNDAVRAVTPGLERFVQVGLVPIAEWLGDKIRDGLKFLQEQFYKIGDWFRENTHLFTEFGEALGEFTNAVWEVIKPILDSAWEKFKDVVSSLLDVFLKLNKNALKNSTSMFKTLADWLKKNQKNVTALVKAFLTFRTVSSVLSKLQEGFVKLKTAMFLYKIANMNSSSFKGMSQTFGGVASSVTALSTPLSNLNSSFSNVNKTFGSTGGIINTVSTSIKNFINNLSPMQKAVGSIAAVATEFVLVSNAVKDFATGTSSLNEMLVVIIPTIGLAGAALSAFLGPIGWVVAGLAGVTAAVKGVIDAQTEMQEALRQEVFDAAIYENGGIAISDLAEAFKDSTEAILDQNDVIMEADRQHQTYQTAIQGSKDQLQYFATISQNSANGIADQDLPKIEEAFNTMTTNVIADLELIAQKMIIALAKTPEDVLARAGVVYPEIVNTISNATAKATGAAQETIKEFQGLYAQLQKDPGNLELQSKIFELASNMDYNGPKITGFADDYKQTIKEIGSIDFGDNSEKGKLAATKALNELGDSYDTAKQALDESKQAIEGWMKDLKGLGWKDEDIAQVKKTFTDIFAIEESDLNQAYQTTVSSIQNQLTSATKEALDATGPTEKEKLSAWWSSLWQWGGQEKNYQNNISETMKKKLDESIDPALQSKLNEMKGKLPPEFESAAKDGAQGFANGFQNPSAWTTMSNNVSSMVKSSIDTARAGLDSHSPSKVFESIGVDAVTGFAQGLNNSSAVSSVNTAMTSLTTNITNIMKNALSGQSGTGTFNQYGQTMMQNLADGISKNVSLPQQAAKTSAESVNTSFKTAFGINGSASSVFSDYGRNLMQGISTGISSNVRLMTEPINSLQRTLNDGISKAMETIKQSVSNSMQNLSSTVSQSMNNLSNSISRAMDNAANSVSRAVSNISNELSRLSSRVDSAMRKLDSLNSKSRSASYSSYDSDDDWGYRSARKAPNIPAFATGGVVRKPTYALVGDNPNAHNNPEVIAPQSTIEEAVRSANMDLASVLVQLANRESDKPIEVRVFIGDREIGKSAAKYAIEEQRRSGKNPYKL